MPKVATTVSTRAELRNKKAIYHKKAVPQEIKESIKSTSKQEIERNVRRYLQETEKGI